MFARWTCPCASSGAAGGAVRTNSRRPTELRSLGLKRCGPDLSVVQRLEYPLRLRHAIALRVVDPERAQHVYDHEIFGESRNGLLARQMTDFVDGPDHLAVDGIVQYLFDEAAVNLQEIHREVLQIAEGRQAGSEVVERELAAQLLQCLDEAVGLGEACDRGGLGDFEADLDGIPPALLQLIDHA